MVDSSASRTTGVRGRNPRGQGERLRDEIVEAAVRMLDELGDDEALSLRAVAREIGIAATSVYIHFRDRDELVFAALQKAHADLLEAVQRAADDVDGSPAKLRARVLVLGRWAHQHPGLYKVLHESTLNRRADLSFKRLLGEETTGAVQSCMDDGSAPVGDAAEVALDLRAAVHGAVSMRVNEPDHPWPPLEDQVDRYLTKLVGIDTSTLR